MACNTAPSGAVKVMRTMQEDVTPIAGFPVLRTDADSLARRLLDALAAGEKRALFFANTNLVVQCRALLPRMHEEGVVVVNDGVGLDIAARLLGAPRFPANLNGTDFTPFLLRQAARPLRLYLVGGKPEVLDKAAAFATNTLGQEVVGCCDGYGGMRGALDLVGAINAVAPDVVLVALGNPIQEAWILNHRAKLDAGIVMGVGALFDFWAGDKPRAPDLVRKLRLEWFYRLCLEPKRLARRYTVDIIRFLAHCHRYRMPLAQPKGQS
ncbi:WecB/TagA/CpsF family glycosyltransferase [Massilia sp. CF038]|uniref:WecB/TagA/CpsF family glycosyltransferase n=1 Tax=Massilia sp. CF038 TaxID=1881045 RepID=UPI0009230022|nr:WecB/TagA/CpsF family glycosyltransferase [Massilia sp. CF038]SHH11719.1 beta-1,4-glucosyltransferase [Massilia sp. CF038]